MTQTLDSLEPGTNLKLMLYGDSGTGKTCFAAGAEGPVYFADFDGKLSSARNFFRDQPEKLKEIHFDSFQIDKTKPRDLPFARFHEKLLELDKLVHEGKFPYKTFVVDSGTTYVEQMLREIIRQNPGVSRPSKDVPARIDYMTLTQFFGNYLSKILSFPCHVIFIAHIKTDKDESTGKIEYTPAFPGQTARKIPIYFEEVYRTFTETGKDGKLQYLAQTQSGAKFICRSQIPNIPNPVELSFSTLLNFLRPETSKGTTFSKV